MSADGPTPRVSQSAGQGGGANPGASQPPGADSALEQQVSLEQPAGLEQAAPEEAALEQDAQDVRALDEDVPESPGGQSATRSLARSGAVMAAGTIVSRVLGMLRSALLTGVLGVGFLASDAFDVANNLPNQFYLLLAGGILNAVLVPQITRAASHKDGGQEFVNRLVTLSMAIMLGATLLVTAAAPLLVALYSGGWTAQTRHLSTTFALICLPQIFFYALYTVLGQVLNARGQFAAYMWVPALANIVGIAGLVYFYLQLPRQAAVEDWTPTMIWVLAGTTTLGVAVQALALVIPLRRNGFRYRPVWGFRGVGLRSASRVALWTFAAVGVSQLGFIVTSRVLTRSTHLAEEHGLVVAGKLGYSNAFLLFMLPHSLVTVSLVTALFTRLSHSVHEGRHDAVIADLGRGLRMPAVLLVPATVAGLILGPLAVSVVLFANPPAQTRAVAGVMMAMLVGIVPFGWVYLIQRVYYAYEDARTPFYLQVVVTAIATVVNVTAGFVNPGFTAVLVGIGQTVSNLAAAVLGFVLLRRRLGPLHLRSTARMYLRMTLASLLAGAVAWGLVMVVGTGAKDSLLARATTLALAAAVFLLLVLGAAHVLQVREVAELISPLLRRLRRRPPGRHSGRHSGGPPMHTT
ncbi:MAG TPA: murein biosynthesis integral membrane protein MurJ [Dermatophilaceae bacterium]|nr:murein biosynthesis integral membrane protein MurJ [Dermatophilaceae bacterium]